MDHFTQIWLKELLEKLGDSNDAISALHSCADVHYRDLAMDSLIEPYRGDIDGFISFLSKTWGWIVNYDKASGIIVADENKPECVCPVLKHHRELTGGTLSATLCHCSEGFASRMFSAVIGHPVQAEVTRSVLRGDSSCVYTICM